MKHIVLATTIALAACTATKTTTRPFQSIHVIDRSAEVVTQCLARGFGVTPATTAAGLPRVTSLDARGRPIREYVIEAKGGSSLVYVTRFRSVRDRREGGCIAIDPANTGT